MTREEAALISVNASCEIARIEYARAIANALGVADPEVEASDQEFAERMEAERMEARIAPSGPGFLTMYANLAALANLTAPPNVGDGEAK